MKFRFRKLYYFLTILPIILATIAFIWITVQVYEPIHYTKSILGLLMQVFIFLPGLYLIIALFPFYRMCYQYLKFSLFQEIIIERDYFEIINTSTSQVAIIKKSDLQKIITVKSVFKMGFLSNFSYIVLYTQDKKIILPCFIIEEDQLFKHLGSFNNFIEDRPWFPTFKKRYINQG